MNGMNGLKNDIKYLDNLVHQYVNGDRNLKSITGILSRVKNQVNELNPNVIEDARIVLEFNKLCDAIHDTETARIADPLRIALRRLEGQLKSGLKVIIDDYCDEMREIDRQIDKIKDVLVHDELKAQYNNVDSYMSIIFKDLLIEELKEHDKLTR